MAEMFPVAFSRILLKVSSGLAFGRDRDVLLLNARKHEPHWIGSFQTGDLDPDEYADFSAFLTDLVDTNGRVDFVHPRFAVPRAYTQTTWPVAEDAELVAVTDLRHIVVSGLAVGTILKRGDRLTVIQGELRCYRSIAQDVVVSSAIAQTLRLSPRLPLGVFAAGAAVRFKLPPIRLAVVPDSYEPDETSRPSPISFDVMEALQ
jgi:hypothetical protein